MGIIRELRKAVAPDDRARPASYECQRCDSLFELQYHVCPNCGGYRVDRVDWELVEG